MIDQTGRTQEDEGRAFQAEGTARVKAWRQGPLGVFGEHSGVSGEKEGGGEGRS